MEKLSEIVRSIGFYVREANFATVGDFWKDIVNFWKQHRFYYIKSGTAQIILKSASLNLTAGNLYYIPKNSVVTAINHEYLEHYFIHFETTDLGNTLLSSLLPVGGGGGGVPVFPRRRKTRRSLKKSSPSSTETAAASPPNCI